MNSKHVLDDIALGKRTVNKLKKRIIPFLFILYVISYLDRVNIGYASLTMNEELVISAAAFGFLSSVFYIGYVVCEVPSNIILHKVGAKKWIARILISWGIVSMLTMFVQDLSHLWIIRFLLGVAEAGFFPGMIYYLSCWFPEKDRAKAVSLFMIGIPVANIIASPVSTWIMQNITWMGLSGWRWMFFWEALPAIIAGIVTFFYLTDKIEDAKWLTSEEKTWLKVELQREIDANKLKANAKHMGIKDSFRYPMIWHLAAIDFCYSLGGIAITLWLPQIVRDLAESLSLTSIGFIIPIPYILCIITMITWGNHSDTKNERRWHTAIPFLLSIVGLVVIIGSDSIIMKFVGIALTMVGLYAAYAPFWAMPTVFLTAEAAAVGVAIINTCANFGGFFSNTAVGLLKDSFGLNAVFIFLLLFSTIGFILTITLPKSKVTSVRKEVFGEGSHNVSEPRTEGE